MEDPFSNIPYIPNIPGQYLWFFGQPWYTHDIKDTHMMMTGIWVTLFPDKPMYHLFLGRPKNGKFG